MTVHVSLERSIVKKHFLDIDQTVIVVDLLCKGGVRNSHYISTNKQYVKIKMMQNETNLWSIFW